MFKEFIEIVAAYLKLKGFTKKGSTFYMLREGNWGVINFQESKDSSKEACIFTINLGTSLTSIRKFEEEDMERRPEIGECHWRKRIGFLLADKKDVWWSMTNYSDLENLSAEIVKILNDIAIPEIEMHLTDKSLEDLWRKGTSDGLTELQRLINLSTLLKLNNKPDLSSIIEELATFARGKGFESTAKYHIRKLLG